MEPTQPDRSKHAHHNTARNSALRILTSRDHSRYELVLKLKKRGFSDENIDDAVAYCERLDYIDDERTAQVYIRQLKCKCYGKKRIHLELKKKGLGSSRLQRILDQSVTETDERQCAENVTKKNIRRFERELDISKRRAKIYRFLHARGFSPDIIRKVANKYS